MVNNIKGFLVNFEGWLTNGGPAFRALDQSEVSDLFGVQELPILVRLMSERIQSMSLNILVYVDGRALADVFPLKKLWQRQLGRNPLRKDDFDKLI